MIENTTENQTQFMEDQALFQRPAPVQSVHAVPSEQIQPGAQQVIVQKKKISPKTIILIASSVITILSILLMMVTGTGKNSLLLTPNPSPSPTPVTGATSDFDKAMNRLNQDIMAADPTVNDLPFPPLNPDLYIVPKQN